MAVSIPADDFTSFLDLGEIDLNFPLHDGSAEHLPATMLAADTAALVGVQEKAGQLDMEMGDAEAGVYTQQSFLAAGQQNALFDNPYEHHQQQNSMPDLYSCRSLTSAPQQFAFNAQQEKQRKEEQRRQLQFGSLTDRRFQHPNAIPPTPASLEMRPLYHTYTPHSDADSTFPAASRYFISPDDAQFTPLVSPAVTPHDVNYDFTTKYALSGTSFSPLSSPALEAQMHQRSYSHHGHTTDSSAATSPLDLDMDNLNYTTRPETEVSRKIRKRTPAPRSVSAATAGKASPSIRPQRRKGTIKSALPSKDVMELRVDEQRQLSLGHYAAGLLAATSRESSDGGSTSPESLSDRVMGPPPKPNSSNSSPSIAGQQWQHELQREVSQVQTLGKSPATPASLMHLLSDQTKQTTKRAKLVSKNASLEMQAMEDLVLPDAATTSKLSKDGSIITSTSSGTFSTTPNTLAGKSGEPLRPIAVPSASASINPAKRSPKSPITAGTPKTSESVIKSGRSLKKRDSTGSKIISPVIWPKISPSIKPLLPEGGTLIF